MSTTHQINITDLKNISKKNLDKYFPSPDFYSLLLLSLVTVTEYSRTKHKLTTKARMDLAANFLNDLTDILLNTDVIDARTYEEIRILINLRKDEIPMIFQAYLYAGMGLRGKISPEKHTSTGCLW